MALALSCTLALGMAPVAALAEAVEMGGEDVELVEISGPDEGIAADPVDAVQEEKVITDEIPSKKNYVIESDSEVITPQADDVDFSDILSGVSFSFDGKHYDDPGWGYYYAEEGKE